MLGLVYLGPAPTTGCDLLLFQAVFTVLLVALVVIFQEELRRGFAEDAAFGAFRERRRPARFTGVDPLIGDLHAGLQSPGLIVIGAEPRSRHVEDPLMGKISKPILYSIFDPHSPARRAQLVEGTGSPSSAHLPSPRT